MTEPSAFERKAFRVPIRHWTKRGTFELRWEQARIGGRNAINIYLDGRYVSFGGDYHEIAAALARGSYDDLVGFPVADSGLPIRVEDWIDPLDALDRPE